jgi:hypothetical protein
MTECLLQHTPKKWTCNGRVVDVGAGAYCQECSAQYRATYPEIRMVRGAPHVKVIGSVGLWRRMPDV